ncbi:transmembrane protein 176A-like isoform X1 [Sminthopsis crassicaudata]|uniref:transmembrane protein 176A-like isoform X1 n=1 Tax=Sminthopsis crassicaudata TaxID=9301 RepID=UPI003D69D9BD
MIPNEMNINGIKINGLEAAGTSQPLHINIHIHQESVLPEFLKTGKTLLQIFVNSAGTLESSMKKSRLQLAIWTAQIILGVMSGALGILFYMGPFFELWYSGAAFWTGAVAIATGVVAIIQEKRKGTWWVFLKILFILATICTSIAAIVIYVADMGYSFYYIYNLCDKSREWSSRSFITPDPQEAWRITQCKSYMNMFQSLLKGIKIMTLLVWITLLVVTLAPIVFTLLRSCCCRQRNLPPEEDVNEKKPLEGDLSFASPTNLPEACEA